MTGAQLWLTVLQDDGPPVWPPTLEDLQVVISASETLHGCNYASSFRTSPIFPVRPDFCLPDLQSAFLCFYCFDPAFPVLGRLVNDGPAELLSHLFFTIGLASVLLIVEDRQIADTVQKIAGVAPRATEMWQVENSRIVDVECHAATAAACPAIIVPPYSALPLSTRATVDEFVANMAVILPKVAVHMPNELKTFTGLMDKVDELVAELIYVSDPHGDPPDSLSEYDSAKLGGDRSLREKILQQDIDRMVQINSALSFVSTCFCQSDLAHFDALIWPTPSY